MELTIEELAEKSGLSVRNIRAYQTRKVLQPPSRSDTGRHTAVYDESHLARLDLVRQLRQRGFSLTAISEMLGMRGQDPHADELIASLAAELRGEPGSQRRAPDEPRHISRSELNEGVGPLAGSAETLAKAISLGLIEPDDDGYVVLSPRLVEAGARLVAVGISIDALLDALGELQLAVRKTQAIIADDFRRAIWEGDSGDGDVDKRLESAIELVAELPAITRDAVDAAIAHEIARAPLIRLLTESMNPPTGD